MKMKHQLFGLVIAAGAMLLPAAVTAEDMGTNANEVKIDNFCFTPPALTVPVGTTVTWINKDDIPHTVASTDHLFTSRALDTDQKFSFTFTTPGTNSYFCSMHPRMTGQIIVK